MEDHRQDLSHDRARPATAEVDDGALVARIVAGDPTLFEILMRRHNQRVYRTVLSILGSDSDVEDVMQQAYMAAFLALEQFRGDAAFSTWLTRIAVNEAIRFRGRGRRFEIVDDSADLTHIESSEVSPEEHAMTDELKRTLERELLSLPAQYRSMIILRDVEGLSTAETATVLELGEGVVRTRLHRARAMMRERLERRQTSEMKSIWTFAGARCDRVVTAIMSEISNKTKGEPE